MINFIGTFISVLGNQDMQFIDNDKDLIRVINKDAAQRYSLENKKYLKHGYIDIDLFWMRYKKRFFDINLEYLDEHYSNLYIITDEQEKCNSVLRTFIKWWLVSDEFFQFLQRFFIKVKVVKVSLYSNESKDTKPIKEFYSFQALEDEEVPFSWQIKLNVTEDATLNVNTHTPVWKLSEDDFRYLNVSSIIKEVSDGYFSFRTHYIVNGEGKSRSEQSYKIAQDLTIVVKDEQIVSVDARETEYSISKNDNWWVVHTPSNEIIPIEDFKPIETIQNKENGTIIYRIYGAYTHVLRNVLWFKPQSWQMKFLLSQNRLSTVAWVRRWWKTMLSSYLIMRELYRNPSFRNRSRQVKALYVAPKEEQYKAVLDYIAESTEKIKMLKVFKWSKDEKRMKLIDERLARNGQVENKVIATCDFASGKGYEPARGNGADFIIIDEAGFIHQDVYLNILPILENERSKLFAISTIDWSTPKNWFYELLCSYEQNEDDEWYAQRVTIDDIDEIYMSASSKERMKKALQSNLQRYFAELYATFPQINSVFSTQSLFCLPETIHPDEVIIWYDPAKRSDYGWVVVGLIKDKTLYIAEEYRLQWEYSTTQRDFIFNLRRRFEEKNIKTSVIIDGTMIGDVVAEAFGTLIDFKIWYTWWGSSGWHPEIDRWWTWKFPKKNLVHMTQSLIDLRMLQAFNVLPILVEELKNFKAYQTQSGNIKYEAASGHDDIVNAMMIAAFYYGFILGNFHTISSENTKDLRAARVDIDPRTGLLRSYSWHRVKKEYDKKVKPWYIF